MIPRKRYGSKNTDQGVYLGLSKTQVLSPATAGSSSSDIAPLPPPSGPGPSPSQHHVLPRSDPGVPVCLQVPAEPSGKDQEWERQE